MKMKPGQTKQFDTFDNLEDRRELVILFQRLGAGLRVGEARQVRADFLARLMTESLGSLASNPIKVDPNECSPSGAYQLFVAMVGVLEVPIGDAARLLDRAVTTRYWMPRTPKLILEPLILDPR